MRAVKKNRAPTDFEARLYEVRCSTGTWFSAWTRPKASSRQSALRQMIMRFVESAARPLELLINLI